MSADDYEVFARDGGPAPLVEALPAHPLLLRDAVQRGETDGEDLLHLLGGEG